jgi:hypothetical protein
LLHAGNPLKDGDDVFTAVPGQPLTGNVLSNTEPPEPGMPVEVTSFRVDGLPNAFQPSTTPVQLVDPDTGAVIGDLTLTKDGDLTFVPAPGYSGPVPSITYTVKSADGQSVQSSLDITVNTQLLDGSEEPTTPAGEALSLNLLDNAQAPNGTTVVVAGFTIAGDPTVYTPGPTAVPVKDATTGVVTGTLLVQADGSVTFTPAAGFSGDVPVVVYTVSSSDGQVNPSALSITVQPGKQLSPVHAWSPYCCSCTSMATADCTPPADAFLHARFHCSKRCCLACAYLSAPFRHGPPITPALLLVVVNVF